jgi:hypothetical protein
LCLYLIQDVPQLILLEELLLEEFQDRKNQLIEEDPFVPIELGKE